MAKPNKNIPIEVQTLARSYTKAAISRLGGIMVNGSEAGQIAACQQLLDRGWGRPISKTEVAGVDGDNEIRVVLRTITEGRK